MEQIYDQNAPKKATNLTVNSDLLRVAKAMNINLSSTLEQALVELVKEKQRAQWREENRQAIERYNAQVDEQGLFSDGLRSF